MADGGLPALQPPPVVPPVASVKTTIPQSTTAQLVVLPVQPSLSPQLNWSHFKPDFSGKPDEGAEAYLLKTNDWMDTHAFKEGVKV